MRDFEARALARQKGHTFVPQVSEQCPYFGEPTGESIDCPTCSARVSLKVFACEVHGKCTPGRKVNGVACCRGCKDRPDNRGGFSKFVRVPDPPPMDLKPCRPWAVATVATNKAGADLLAISRPSLHDYAERLGADFVVLDWPGVPEYPISAKFALPRILEHYERVVFLDADILVASDALDLFEAVEPDELGIYDDLPEILIKGTRFIDEYQRFREAMKLKRSPVRFYGNTGVMVLSKMHREVLTVPPEPMPVMHCAEQHWWISRMHECGTKLRFLPKKANWQWWPRKTLADAPRDAILHFSGMQGKTAQTRLELMRSINANIGNVVSRPEPLISAG